MTNYDVHAHCVPNGLLEELESDEARYGTQVLRDGEDISVRFGGGEATRPIIAGLRDVSHRLESMDAAGIDVQLLSSWIDLTGYTLPNDVAARYTRMFNEKLAATVETHPSRFRGLCNVPLQDPAAAAAELRHAVGELGMVGAEISTTVDGVDLDDRDLDPFWAQAAELRCPIVIHPYLPLRGRDVSRYLLENLVGRAAESTIAIAHMVFGGVFERFPDLCVIMVHGGGFVPWQLARWDHGFSAVPAKTAVNLDAPPSRSLRNVYFDTVLFDPAVIGYLIDWAGVDRVVLGSDYPFPMGDLTPVDTLDAVGELSEQDRAAVLEGNVERLLAGIRR